MAKGEFMEERKDNSNSKIILIGIENKLVILLALSDRSLSRAGILGIRHQTG